MVLMQEIIHQAYFIFSLIASLLLVRAFLRRSVRTGVLNDVAYAITIIPFLLRALHIK